MLAIACSQKFSSVWLFPVLEGMDYYPCDPDFYHWRWYGIMYWLVVWNIFYDFPNSWDMLGWWSNLTHIFQGGWNHQLERDLKPAIRMDGGDHGFHSKNTHSKTHISGLWIVVIFPDISHGILMHIISHGLIYIYTYTYIDIQMYKHI